MASTPAEPVPAANLKHDFTHDPSVSAFLLSPPGFIARHFPAGGSTSPWPPAPRHLAAGAIVFDRPLPSITGTTGTSGTPGTTGTTATENGAVTSTATGTTTGTTTNATATAQPALAHPPRVLLVQRAPTDSNPLRWETPGGGCDLTDESVLSACARELAEEAGLCAVRVGPLVQLPSTSTQSFSSSNASPSWATGSDNEAGGGWNMGGLFFLSRRGSLTCKFWFVVDAGGDPEGRVVLNPKEHVRHLWATEDEVREKRIAPRDGGDGDGERLVFTSRNQWEVILEAFKLWK